GGNGKATEIVSGENDIAPPNLAGVKVDFDQITTISAREEEPEINEGERLDETESAAVIREECSIEKIVNDEDGNKEENSLGDNSVDSNNNSEECELNQRIQELEKQHKQAIKDLEGKLSSELQKVEKSKNDVIVKLENDVAELRKQLNNAE